MAALIGTVMPPAPARQRVVVRLWLPLTLLWILLAPFAVLFAPLILLVPTCRYLNPFGAAFRVGALLLGCSGTIVEVDAPGVLVRIRIL